MSNKLKVILISGKIGSGKDTTANMLHRILKEQGNSPVVRNLSAPLKKAVAYITGEDEGLFYSRAHKGGEQDEKDRRRRLLVDVGKAVTNVDTDAFSKFTFNEMLHSCKPKGAIGIVSDIRHKAELDYFEKHCDAFVVRLVGSFEPCTNEEVANSPSETELDYLDELLIPGTNIGLAGNKMAIQLHCTNSLIDKHASELTMANRKAFNVRILEEVAMNAIGHFKSK